MAILRKKPAGVRWAKLSEIDRRVKVGSDHWKSQPYRIRQLSAWRADHLGGSHKPVRRFARAKHVKPSSNITLGSKVSFFTNWKKRRKL